jgi:hypothetical protein
MKLKTLLWECEKDQLQLWENKSNIITYSYFITIFAP